MPASNHTPNYELPILLGSDKPDWLSDFNDAMDKIDNGMSGNKVLAMRAEQTANNAMSTVQDIPELRQQIADNTDHIRIVENRLNQTTATVMSFQADINKININAAEINVEMGTLRQQQTEVLSQIADVNANTAVNTSDIASIEDTIKHLQDIDNELDLAIKGNDNDIANLGNNLSVLTSHVTEIETETENKFAAVTSTITSLKAYTEKEFAAVTSTIQSLTSTVYRLSEDITENQTSIEDLQVRVEEIEKDISGDTTAEPPSKGLTDRVADLETEQATTDMRLEALEDTPIGDMDLELISYKLSGEYTADDGINVQSYYQDSNARFQLNPSVSGNVVFKTTAPNNAIPLPCGAALRVGGGSGSITSCYTGYINATPSGTMYNLEYIVHCINNKSDGASSITFPLNQTSNMLGLVPKKKLTK